MYFEYFACAFLEKLKGHLRKLSEYSLRYTHTYAYMHTLAYSKVKRKRERARARG